MMFNPKFVRTSLLPAALATCAGLAGLTSSARADVNFTNFNSVAGLDFCGVAAQTPDIELPVNETDRTISVTRSVGDKAGAFWAHNQQDVTNGFVCDFAFRIRDKNGIGADGMAFVIQEDPRGNTALGGKGGAIGFASNPYFPAPTYPGPGISHSVAIVFDTWDNSGDWTSIHGTNIVTVQLNSNPFAPNQASSTFSIANALAGGAFNDSSIHHVEIKYQPGALQVFLDSPVALLTAQIDLGTQLALTGTDAFVGFTAATGGSINSQRQEIASWSFTSTIPGPASASLMLLGSLIATRRRRP